MAQPYWGARHVFAQFLKLRRFLLTPLNTWLYHDRPEAGVHSQHRAGVLAHEPGELHCHGAGPGLHQLDVRCRSGSRVTTVKLKVQVRAKSDHFKITVKRLKWKSHCKKIILRRHIMYIRLILSLALNSKLFLI